MGIHAMRFRHPVLAADAVECLIPGKFQ